MELCGLLSLSEKRYSCIGRSLERVQGRSEAGPSTATVTFLFTDVEGSTRLWEAHPDAMGELVARHDKLIAEAVERNAGRVFKTVGDACCAVFSSAPSAVMAAIEIQAEMETLTHFGVGPLRVRTALHTGEAQIRGGDYFGSALSRVARLLSIGHGRQVLLSLSTQELAREAAPKESAFLDLGSHRLKDLQHPERVFQLAYPGLCKEFPPLRSLSALPNNLPQQVSSFIGREKEIAEVRAALDHSRLLTLTGAGGSGKTRLAVQVAAETLHRYSDGVWFAEFASLTEATLVSSTACRAANIREVSDKSPTDALSEALRDKEALLIFDNCEHVLEQAAKLAERLLWDCPGIRILATSREPLRISGESTFRIPSMAIPDGAHGKDLERIADCDSVRLLLERAKALKPEFQLSDRTAPFAAEICRRLDGIPLAIELAAARVQYLSIDQIASRLDDRFRLLTGGSRTALPRQQTLRALIEWSYDLLEPKEKELLNRLSVFAGGWSLDAAERVCADEDGSTIEAFGVLEVLGSLVEKSLAVYDETRSDAGRYWLLESVRQFARERLEAADGSENLAAQIASRHAEHYLRFAEEHAGKLTGPEQKEGLAMLDLECENLRAAIEFCKGCPDSKQAGLQLVGRMGRYWMIRGSVHEGLAHTNAVLAVAGASSSEEPSDLAALASALTTKGTLHWLGNNLEESKTAFEQALKIQHKLDDDLAKAGLYSNLAVVAIAEMDYDRAHDWVANALGLNKKLKNKHGIASALGALGTILEKRGEYDKAAQRYSESLELWKELGNRHAMGVFLNNLGSMARRSGNLDEARSYAVEALLLRKELGDRQGTIWSIEAFAKLAVDEGRFERAATLLGAADAHRRSTGIALAAIDRQDMEETIRSVREAAGEELFEAAWERGAGLVLDEAVGFALESVPTST